MDQNQTAKQMIDARWRDVEPPFSLPEEARRIANDLADDPSFRSQFCEMVYSVVYDRGQRILATNRALIVHGQQAMTPEQVRERVRDQVKADPTPWGELVEYVPITKKYIAFAQMTKPELLAAAVAREARGDAEYTMAGFFRLVAGKMNDTGTVADAWSENDLRALYENLRVTSPTVGLANVAAPPVAIHKTNGRRVRSGKPQSVAATLAGD